MNASKTLIITAVIITLDSENSAYLEVLQQRSEIFGKMLGMPSKFEPSVDGEFGRQRPDGTWTGMVGMLLNNTADLAFCISYNEERSPFVDFSFPFDGAPVSFITQKPAIGDKTFTFIQPFTGAVWLASILSLFLFSLVFHKLLRGRYSFDSVIFNMFRNQLRDSSRIKAAGLVENLLQMTWVVGMMLLAYFYSAVLLSFFSCPTRIGVRDIPELATAVSRGTHRCLTFSGGHIPNYLINFGKESFQMIGQNLLENIGDVDSNTVEKGLQRKGVVYVVPVSMFNLFRDHYFFSEDTFFQVGIQMGYGKNFCCADKLHTGILRATAAGLFDKIQNDLNLRRTLSMLVKMAGESESTEQKLSLKDLSGVFLLLITGLVLASFVFILETVSQKIQCPLYLNKNKRKYKRDCKKATVEVSMLSESDV